MCVRCCGCCLARCRIVSLDRLRQCSKSSAGPRRQPHARVGRTRRARGRTQPYCPPALTEALLIGLAAGAIGVASRSSSLRMLPLLDPGNIPRLHEASLDMRVLLFTVAVSLLDQRAHRRSSRIGCVAHQPDGLPRHHRQPQRGRRAYPHAKRSHRRRIGAGRRAAGLGGPVHSQLHQRRIGRHRLLAIHRHSEHWARSAL